MEAVDSLEDEAVMVVVELLVVVVVECQGLILLHRPQTRWKAGANTVRNKQVRIFGGLLMGTSGS